MAEKATPNFDVVSAFHKIKGHLNHHIASFDHLVQTEMKKILLNVNNREIKSQVDPDFFVRYTDVCVESPRLGTGGSCITPHECRTTNGTYSGDIKVSIEYMKREGSTKRVVSEQDLVIGRMPIMLRSRKCNLYGKSHDEITALRECPLDPGGYFIVKGVERVCIVQEQQSKNRIIVEATDNGGIEASVQSKTHYSISKCTLLFKKNRIVLVQKNSFVEDIPIVVVLKALGLGSDQAITAHVGTPDDTAERVLYNCLEHAQQCKVTTQAEALAFIGSKRKTNVVEADDEIRSVGDRKSVV